MRVLALLMMLAPVVVAFVPSSTGSVRPATALFSSVQKAQLETMIKDKAAQKIQLDTEIAMCRKNLAQVDYDSVIANQKAKAEEAGEVFVAPEPPKPKKKSKRFDLKVWWKENVMME